MASAYLQRTAGTPTSEKKFTVSFWIKRCATGVDEHLFDTYNDASNRTQISFTSGADVLDCRFRVGNTNIGRLVTDRKFRDLSAWYHIVLAVDTTQATAADRIKLYVNGTQETDFSTETYMSQNADTDVSGTHTVGAFDNGGSETSFLDGYLAHYHFTDGYTYAASTFGQTDSTTGIWKPITSPSVTYGTNGFFLKFQDSSNFGDDSSGNTNDLTKSGTIIKSPDTPSNNFPTMDLNMNPILVSGAEHNSGGLVVGGGTNDYSSAASMAVKTGKWYWELKLINASNTRNIGIVRTDKLYSTSADGFYIGHPTTSITPFTVGLHLIDGIVRQRNANTTTTTSSTNGTTNDIFGIALDLTSATQTIAYYKNGSLSVTVNLDSGFSGYYIVPATRTDTGQDIAYNFGSGYFQTTAVASSNSDANGIGLFEYPVPTGYYAICTKNIKEFG